MDCFDAFVPSELRSLPQWVRWRVEPRSAGEKPTKIPYQWIGNRRAKTDDPATWGSYALASQYLPLDSAARGLGFVFTDSGGLVGIDLDGCRDPADGTIADWAKPILDRFRATYAEVSPSQTGVKIFARGRLPTDRTGKKVAMPGEHCGIEAYQRGRFFCVTGQKIDTALSSIADCQPSLDWLWQTYLRPAVGVRATPIAVPGTNGNHDNRRAFTRAVAYLTTMPPAIQGQNGSGATFRAACELFRFGLDDAEAASLLDQFSGRCVPPWSAAELRHKLADARDEVNERGEFGARLAERNGHAGANGQAAEPPKPNEADDDYHRLARVNLEQYSARNGGRTIRYWRDEWYVWRDTHYRIIPEKELKAKITHSIKREFDRLNVEKIEDYEYRKAKGELKEGEEEKGRPIAKRVSIGMVASVLGATAGITSLSSFIEPMTWLPTREVKNYVAMQNGIIDMDAVIADRDDYLIPHSPDWFSTICLPYAFNVDAECPKWEAFLDRNLEGDQERIKLLQEWAGYLLLPDTGQQKFLVLRVKDAMGNRSFVRQSKPCLAARISVTYRSNCSAKSSS